MAIPLSGVLGGPLAGGLLGLTGHLGLAGWQWLFLLEGLPAVGLGFVVLCYLTDRPEEARWLSPAERAWLTRQLYEERERRREYHGLTVRQALANPTVLQLGLLHFLCFTFGTYVQGLWLPQIIRGFSGLSDFKIGLVSAVPNVAAAVSMTLVGAHSDRTGERLRYIAAAGFIAACAYVAGASLHSPTLIVLALSVSMVGQRSATGPFWVLPSTFLTGSAAAGGIALINSVSNLSGLVGPYVFGLLRQASGSFHSGMLLLALVTLAGAALALHLRRAPVLSPPLGTARI
jgi:ACS family tartrate transporter-like MFS transporter